MFGGGLGCSAGYRVDAFSGDRVIRGCADGWVFFDAGPGHIAPAMAAIDGVRHRKTWLNW